MGMNTTTNLPNNLVLTFFHRIEKLQGVVCCYNNIHSRRFCNFLNCSLVENMKHTTLGGLLSRSWYWKENLRPLLLELPLSMVIIIEVLGFAPTMQFWIDIPKITQENSYSLSLTINSWKFQNNTLQGTL